MEIPQSTFDRWLSLKEENDIKLLADLIGKSTETVMRIFRTKEGKTEYLVAINGFYKKRQKEFDKIKLPD